VTSELIDVCQKITAGTVKPIEFQFFLNNPKQDLGYYSGLSTLRRSLPNSKIHFYQDYNAYMNVLAQCKFAIPTLPFGGSNSNMDCLRIKLPKLYIADDRAFVGYTDLRIWQSLGIDIGFCHSIDNLVTRAIELIDDEKALAGFKNELNTFDLEAYDKKIDSNELDNRMSDTFKQLITSAL
jgi:predicted O-linked N-acetylglucosamine transferase (SPINDLY family)